MKNFLFITCFIFIAGSVKAQFELGIKAGISSMDLASEGIIVQNENNNLELNFTDAEYGVHFGLYSRLSLLGIFIEPAAIFNSSTVNYTVDDYSEGGVISTLKNESYRYVDVPLMVGCKLGFFRIQGGPVAHFYLDSTSELFDIDGYKQNFKDARYGFQLGGGLDIGKLRLDCLYEGNLNKFGDHINIGGEEFAFSDSASRVVFNVGIKF